MRIREFAPSPRLRPFVQLLWCLELEEPAEFGPPERIVPDGIVEAVFHYREPMAVRFAGEAFDVQPRSSVVSQTRRFIEIQPRGATGLVSVRFRPWGAHRFSKIPISELADRVVDAADLWGAGVRELEERLAAAAGAQCRVALVERFLLGRRRDPAGPEIEPLVREVWRRRGNLRVAQLCRDLGVTERSIERACSATLGTPPKSFARLVRFLYACSEVRSGDWSTLTDVAHDCGYYDQAHFIADFKALSGMTPGEFSAARPVSFLELG